MAPPATSIVTCGNRLATISRHISLATGILLATWQVLSAQSTSSGDAPSASDASEKTVVLSPFIIQASSDKGYVAQETLAGTRLRMPIADTPVSLTVMTSDLLDDIGATDFRDVVDFIPSTDSYRFSSADVTGSQTKNPLEIMVRGFPTTTQSKDFFQTSVPADRYLTDRITYTRGPNTLLFGIGNPGGIVAVEPRRALADRNRGEIDVLYDSRHGRRASLDQNLVLAKDRLAVRGDLLLERKKGFREPTEQNKDGAFVTATINPFKRSTATSVILSYEYGKRDDVAASPFAPFDGFSTWAASGAPLYNNLADPRPPTVLNATTPFSRLENQYISVLGQSYISPFQGTIGQRINGQTYNSFVQTNGQIINGSVVAPQTTGGNSITGDFVSLNPKELLLNYFKGDQGRLNAWLTALGPARSIPDTFDNGPTQISMKTFLSGKEDRITQYWHVPRLIVNQHVGRNFEVQLAGNMERFSSLNRTMLRGTDYTIRYDPNLYLPDGAQNPFAGVPYVSNENFATLNRENSTSYEYRLMTDYRLDLNQRTLFGMPLGRYDFATLFNFFQSAEEVSQQRPHVTSIGGVPAPNIANNANIVHSRYYLLPGHLPYITQPFVPLPPNSRFQADWINFSGSRTRTVINSYAASINGYLLRDRLVLLLGARQDEAKTWTTAAARYTAADVPAGRYIGEVNLPATYTTLNPLTNDTVVNYSAGGVYHLTKWFSPFYNYATNSQPSSVNRDILQQVLPYVRGTGRDYGLKFSLLGGRLQGSYTHYVTAQQHSVVNVPSGAGSMSTLLFTNVQLAEPDYYAAWQKIGTAYKTQQNLTTTGDELQATFNPTPNLRLRVAASRQKTIAGGAWQDVEKFLAVHVPIWKSYAANPATPAVNAQTVAAAIPVILADEASFLSVNGSPQIGQSEYGASLSANYSFDWKPLSGFAVGTNVSYRGPVLLGYQVNEDGSAVLSNQARGSGPKYVDFNVSYSRRFSQNKYLWQVRLQVANAFDSTRFNDRRALWDYTATRFVITSRSMPEPRMVTFTSRIAF